MNAATHDVIIIGGGPAGLTGGIYAARELLSSLILEKASCGGWPLLAGTVENYPGFPEGINGSELVERFKRQAEKFGVQFREFEEVTALQADESGIAASTASGEHRSRAVIVASGSRFKKLGIPGESEFLGKGVSYCATCDGPLFRSRAVAVIGGGSAALEEALFLTKFASRVYLVHRRDAFRGSAILVERLRKEEKVEFVLNATPVEIRGEKSVGSITVRDKLSGAEKNLEVSGVFIFVGAEPNSGFLKGVSDLDAAGYVKTDLSLQTSRPGVFAAGDVRSRSVRQIVAACGEGAAAALSVREFLQR